MHRTAGPAGRRPPCPPSATGGGHSVAVRLKAQLVRRLRTIVRSRGSTGHVPALPAAARREPSMRQRPHAATLCRDI